MAHYWQKYEGNTSLGTVTIEIFLLIIEYNNLILVLSY